MKRLVLLIVILVNCFYAICQKKSSFTLNPYLRVGLLAVKPSHPDWDYTVSNDYMTYKGAVIGFGNDFSFNMRKVSFGGDIGYSSVFNNSYNGGASIGESYSHNKVSEFYFFPYVDLFVAKNLFLRFGIGGHFLFEKWEYTYVDGGSTQSGTASDSYLGLIGAIGYNIPINEKISISTSLKANPLFSSSVDCWGFLMPVTLNVGLKIMIL
jgi:hypothetical protein